MSVCTATITTYYYDPPSLPLGLTPHPLTVLHSIALLQQEQRTIIVVYSKMSNISHSHLRWRYKMVWKLSPFFRNWNCTKSPQMCSSSSSSPPPGTIHIPTHHLFYLMHLLEVYVVASSPRPKKKKQGGMKRRRRRSAREEKLAFSKWQFTAFPSHPIPYYTVGGGGGWLKSVKSKCLRSSHLSRTLNVCTLNVCSVTFGIPTESSNLLQCKIHLFNGNEGNGAKAVQDVVVLSTGTGRTDPGDGKVCSTVGGKWLSAGVSVCDRLIDDRMGRIAD